MDRQEEIRKLAYELYERSGMIPGREIENWLKAEKIVEARYAETEKTTKPATRKKAVRPGSPKSPAAKTASKKTASARKSKKG